MKMEPYENFVLHTFSIPFQMAICDFLSYRCLSLHSAPASIFYVLSDGVTIIVEPGVDLAMCNYRRVYT